MNKFDGLLIVTDLDGTLLRGDKSISKENLNAIEYFKANGGFFTFITGRPPMSSFDVCQTINPNAPFGCMNGGGIYDHIKKEYMWIETLPHSVLELVESVDKNMPTVGIQVCTPEKVYFCKDNPAMIRHRIATNLPNYACSYYDIKEPITKIVFTEDDENTLFALRDMLNVHELAENFGFIRSDKDFYEIVPKGINKGTVVNKLSQMLGIDLKRTIAIGDNDNDESMIRVASLGVAVSNASESAKSAADYITVSNEEHAIAKIIYNIETGNIKI